MEKIRYSTEEKVIPVRGGEAVIRWENATKLTITLPYNGAFGLGEKFNALNQKNLTAVTMIEEKCTFQGEKTYVVSPFFFTDTGFGFYADVLEPVTFTFGETSITVELMKPNAVITLFAGKPEEIIRQYMGLFGKAPLPPEWAFGPWVSANRWNTQERVEEVLQKLKDYRLPTSVLVIEAWLGTNYFLWDGAEYRGDFLNEPVTYDKIDFSQSKYPDPQGMINKLHEAGIRLILWQAPVYPHDKPGSPYYNRIAYENIQHVLDKHYCVMKKDGTPYFIPKDKWFGGAPVPDFTNPEAKKDWFDKRRYLLDMGIDGFKTDGGEFIHEPDALLYDGTDGNACVNRYARDYTEAYRDFVGPDRVLFSRAGYSGQHTVPILWGGDQQSKNCEMASVLRAGLSAALTGIIFWGFDIAGFATEMPTIDLYRRGTQLGCFCPIMQWHSEPRFDGQDNERSPWHMAELYHCPEFIDEMRYWYDLRMQLMPYLLQTAKNCVETDRPMMRPLVYEWPDDISCVNCDDEFMLGDDLLVAPLMEENAESRKVYLPEGEWINVFDHKRYSGKQTIVSGGDKKLPVFVRAEHANIWPIRF